MREEDTQEHWAAKGQRIQQQSHCHLKYFQDFDLKSGPLKKVILKEKNF